MAPAALQHNQQPPLNYAASSTLDPHIARTMPPEVVTCLKNARFLHLATCNASTPHVSLMNYTYLPSTPFRQSPTIIMTTNPASRKTLNLRANPQVSLLVHDWVSHRPSQTAPTRRDGSPVASRSQSGLAAMLMNMNTSALSRISTTINGTAEILEGNSEEELWCKDRHLENNTFDAGGADGSGGNASASLLGTSPGETPVGDGGRGCYIEGEAVQVVVVTIKDGRIADWKGGVHDWAIELAGESLMNGA